MSSRRKGADIVETLHAYSLDLKNRELYLVGHPDAWVEDEGEPGVEHLMASRFIKSLRFLSTISQEPVLIHLKTCGGHYEEGMAIYEAIRWCPCYVAILSYTHARSMSSIILQAADRRVLMPHSYFMFHMGDMYLGGTWKRTMTIAAWEKRIGDGMVDLYAERLKRSDHGKFRSWSLKRIKEMLQGEMDKKEDVFLTAQEAVKWGFADEVFNGDWGRLTRG